MFEDDRYVCEDEMQKLAEENAKSQMKLEKGICYGANGAKTIGC